MIIAVKALAQLDRARGRPSRKRCTWIRAVWRTNCQVESVGTLALRRATFVAVDEGETGGVIIRGKDAGAVRLRRHSVGTDLVLVLHAEPRRLTD